MKTTAPEKMPALQILLSLSAVIMFTVPCAPADEASADEAPADEASAEEKVRFHMKWKRYSVQPPESRLRTAPEKRFLKAYFDAEFVMFQVWGVIPAMGMSINNEHLVWIEGLYGDGQYRDETWGAGIFYSYRLQLVEEIFALRFGAGFGLWYTSHLTEAYRMMDAYFPSADTFTKVKELDVGIYFATPTLGLSFGHFAGIVGFDLNFRLPVGIHAVDLNVTDIQSNEPEASVFPLLSAGIHIVI